MTTTDNGGYPGLGTVLRHLGHLPEVRTCHRCAGTGLEPRATRDSRVPRRDCVVCRGQGEHRAPGGREIADDE